MCSIVVLQILGFVTFLGFPIPPFPLGVISQDNQTTCLKHRLFHRGCKSENQISKPVRSVCKIRIPIFWVKAWGNPFWLSDSILTTHRSFLLSFVIFVRQVELLGIWILARRDVTIYFGLPFLFHIEIKGFNCHKLVENRKEFSFLRLYLNFTTKTEIPGPYGSLGISRKF